MLAGLRESTERVGGGIAALAGRGAQRVGYGHDIRGNRGRGHVKRRQGDVINQLSGRGRPVVAIGDYGSR
jgi:hypothetical protein